MDAVEKNGPIIGTSPGEYAGSILDNKHVLAGSPGGEQVVFDTIMRISAVEGAVQVAAQSMVMAELNKMNGDAKQRDTKLQQKMKESLNEQKELDGQ